MADSIDSTKFNGLAAGSSLKASCAITASTTSGVIASAINPENVPVIATLAYVHIKTPSTVAAGLDIGVATTAVSSDTLMDGIGVNMPANTVYDNITDHGTNGLTRQYVAAGSYFTAAVASGDANGLVADFYFDYMLLSGGHSFIPGLTQ